MTIFKLESSVVVFDLDDTLFKEDRYHISGVTYVCDQLERLYGINITTELMQLRKDDIDLWQHACTKLDLPDSVKESLIWMYRLHSPSIEIDKATRNQIASIHDSAIATIILTDGRSISQRQKLLSLGLSSLPAYISEEWESSKPDARRFNAIMDSYSAQDYIYVGDNVAKDFIAPNSLGWITIGLIDDGSNIHHQPRENLLSDAAPAYWIEKITELAQYY